MTYEKHVRDEAQAREFDEITDLFTALVVTRLESVVEALEVTANDCLDALPDPSPWQEQIADALARAVDKLNEAKEAVKI